ncbi:6-pyruvoyl trahydropterin synthase family protein [Thalassoglobus sp.]|uniref:6-pyruvoyl trahydropterin synthase family protein n=1 Tax=Thalassoglobus sp. TaxID=2795869 RepID=UPI003AA90668
MPVSRTFSVDVTKDHLVFSAAHFITIGEDLCERLHGHNWRVAARVEGTLDENQYVFDFIALRDTLQHLVDQLDHRMLLATEHPKIRLHESDREVEVTYVDRRWIFPKDECILLPIQQTTAELLAQWLGERLLEGLVTENLTSLTIKVEENFGQWAGCTFHLNEE